MDERKDDSEYKGQWIAHKCEKKQEEKNKQDMLMEFDIERGSCEN